MSLLNEIASAIGHTPETLAHVSGTSVEMLDHVVGGLSASGIDVFSSASRLGLTPDGLLSGIVQIMNSGDPHQQFLSALQAPVQPLSDPLASLTTLWLQMADLHQNTAQAIDRHIQDLFSSSGPESYSGPAADTLWNAHQDLQRYFNTLIDHAQTQHTRHKTLSGHVDDYTTQMPIQVNSLSAPVAAFGLLSIQMVSAVAPAWGGDPYVWPLINTQPLVKQREDVEQEAKREQDLGKRTLLESWARVLAALIFLAGILNTLDRAISYHNTQQKQTSTPPPTGTPSPGTGSGLTQTQQQLLNDVKSRLGNTPYNDADIEALIKAGYLDPDTIAAIIKGGSGTIAVFDDPAIAKDECTIALSAAGYR